jgi:hypothetical protein
MSALDVGTTGGTALVVSERGRASWRLPVAPSTVSAGSGGKVGGVGTGSVRA